MRNPVAVRLCVCGAPCRPHTFFCGDECRFWDKVQKGPGCWLWTASQKQLDYYPEGKSYGQFTINRDGRRINIGAHVYAYQLVHGPVPEGMEVMHACDNPPCVRPDHLSAGTHTDNVRDAARKGHYDGPKPYIQRLDASEIDDIRFLVASGVMQKTVAKTFGITEGYVSQIVSGKCRQYDAPIGATREELAS